MRDVRRLRSRGGARLMTTLEALRAARRLITDPEHWCQESSAREADGTNCSVHHPGARSFCAAGALWKVTGTYLGSEDDERIVDAAAMRLHAATGWSTNTKIVEFNDHVTTDHAAVLAVYDKAICAEEWEEEIYA